MNFMKFWEESITNKLLILMIIVFTLELIFPNIEDNFSLIPALSIFEPWRFITSIFLHADFFHIFWNGFALLMFGNFLEARISKKDYILLFFVSGIFGNILFYLFNPNSSVHALGASGAIFGILGCLGILYPNLTVYFGLAPMPMIFAVIIWGVISFFGIFIPSYIAHEAHLGGLIIGIIYGIYLRKKFESQRIKRRKIIYYFA
ncbi:MAG: rhomboid family intramembrane serine protease [Candidatus Aenigmarchaeota archaeon ex4484_224]|nr:MAG: rhomboid family intramembrane serine protease [Candidatus Aenigmarchaeota archaeon ex4484_224]